jgi:hypothetical protein
MNGTKGIKTLRFVSWVAAVAVIAVLAGTGCAAKVNRDVLMTVKKVGILSVTIDKMGTQTTDDEVMQSTVNYAARRYADALANRPEWKLVPLSAYKDNPQFRDFLKVPVAQKKPTGGKEATGFAAVLNKLNTGWQSAMTLESFAQRESSHYLGASDMPIIPYKMIGKAQATSSTSQTKKGSMQVKEDWSSLQKEMCAKVGELATKLKLDGLMVIYLHTDIRQTVGIGVTLGERGNDTVRMDPTLVLVSKDGKTAIDMGEPVIDALTTSNASVPLYKAEGHQGGTINMGTNRPGYIIDLKDPKGKVQKDLYELTDDALKDFMKDLDKELTKK